MKNTLDAWRLHLSILADHESPTGGPRPHQSGLLSPPSSSSSSFYLPLAIEVGRAEPGRRSCRRLGPSPVMLRKMVRSAQYAAPSQLGGGARGEWERRRSRPRRIAGSGEMGAMAIGHRRIGRRAEDILGASVVFRWCRKGGRGSGLTKFRRGRPAAMTEIGGEESSGCSGKRGLGCW